MPTKMKPRITPSFPSAQIVVIQNVKTGEFWNNDSGWGDLKQAEHYSEGDSAHLRLPVDGKWVDLPLAKKDEMKQALIEET